MQVLCGLQVVFFLFNCQTPVHMLEKADEDTLAQFSTDTGIAF